MQFNKHYFLDKAKHRNVLLRRGQAIYIDVYDLFPNEAIIICDTSYDCFYDDSKIDLFLEKMEQLVKYNQDGEQEIDAEKELLDFIDKEAFKSFKENVDNNAIKIAKRIVRYPGFHFVEAVYDKKVDFPEEGIEVVLPYNKPFYRLGESMKSRELRGAKV